MQPLGSLEGTKDFESGGNGANTLPGGGGGGCLSSFMEAAEPGVQLW